VKVVRVLVYEGSEEWIEETLRLSTIKVEGKTINFSNSLRSSDFSGGTITEILRMSDRREVNEAKKA